MTVKSSAASPPEPNQDLDHLWRRRLAAILLGAVVFGLYLRTSAPGLLGGDAGEFQMAAWRWGLAHPTGYPLYLLAGGFWQRGAALLGFAPDRALNAFSALSGGLAVALLFDWMGSWQPGRPAGRWLAALTAAFLFAANPTFWGQSLIAEVYRLHGLFTVGILYLAGQAFGLLKSRPDHDACPGGDSRSPLLLFFLLGLALAHHRSSFFLLPGLLAAWWWVDRRWWQRGKMLAGVLLALALPQLLYLYIPLRSGPESSPWLYQRLGDGEVLVLFHNTWQGFADMVTGAAFSTSFLEPQTALARLPQVGQQWLDHFTWAGLLLGLLGLIDLGRRRAWPVLLLTVPYALIQQAFNLFYGIDDIYVYYIPLYLVGAIWAGFGAGEVDRAACAALAGGGRCSGVPCAFCSPCSCWHCRPGWSWPTIPGWTSPATGRPGRCGRKSWRRNLPPMPCW